jgi:hypothetical protein
MTLSELQERRDEIVRTLGVARVQFGERSVEYAKQAEALQAIDREIARLTQPGEATVFTIQSKRGVE